MSNSSESSNRRILDAAKTLFAQYGFQRTGMTDIAKAAGMSRPALYLRFDGKPAVFRALAESIKDDALAAAAAAWDEARGLADNLAAIILAKDLPLFRLLHASPHGADLMAVDAELTAAIATELDVGFAAILTGRLAALEATGAVALSELGGPATFARTLAMAAAGLKDHAADEPAYIEAVTWLCRLAARAASISAAGCR